MQKKIVSVHPRLKLGRIVCSFMSKIVWEILSMTIYCPYFIYILKSTRQKFTQWNFSILQWYSYSVIVSQFVLLLHPLGVKNRKMNMYLRTTNICHKYICKMKHWTPAYNLEYLSTKYWQIFPCRYTMFVLVNAN